MADYSSVLSRAVAGKKTYEERRAVYERARSALVHQLRSLEPPLPEGDITRQRLSLEEAIRKVEAEISMASAAAQGPSHPAAPPPAEAPPPPPPSPPPPSPRAAPTAPAERAAEPPPLPPKPTPPPPVEPQDQRRPAAHLDAPGASSSSAAPKLAEPPIPLASTLRPASPPRLAVLSESRPQSAQPAAQAATPFVVPVPPPPKPSPPPSEPPPRRPIALGESRTPTLTPVPTGPREVPSTRPQLGPRPVPVDDDPPPPPFETAEAPLPSPEKVTRTDGSHAFNISPLRDTVRDAGTLGAAAATATRSARDVLGARETTARLEQRTPYVVDDELPLGRVRALPATEPPKPERDHRFLVFGLIALAILILVGGLGYGLWKMRGDAPSTNSQTPSTQTGPIAPKIPDRITPDGTPSPQSTQTPGDTQTATNATPSIVQPAVQGPQNAYLYEENADNPKGADTFRGTVNWRIDTEPGASGPEKIIRGLIEIPERGLKMLLTVRRNVDNALPASHTVELLFDVAPNFVHGAVESVAGLRMKPSEQANGLPLVGASARITGGYFLIGLSALAPDRERNVVLLRDRPWMDLPLLYRNGRRAVLAIEKGPPGEKVFQDAFAAWGG